jgi:hypothetical protein
MPDHQEDQEGVQQGRAHGAIRYAPIDAIVDQIKKPLALNGFSYAAVAVKLSHIKALSDLYFLKSDCDQAARRALERGFLEIYQASKITLWNRTNDKLSTSAPASEIDAWACRLRIASRRDRPSSRCDTSSFISQCSRIEQILLREGKIDNFYCIHTRLTLRLAARISDLKEKGYQIRTEERDDKNTVYHLVAVPKPQQLALVLKLYKLFA